jgi:hypothetical protein
MLFPIQNQFYTAARKQFENDLFLRNYSREIILTTINQEEVPETTIQKYHSFFQNPLFVILENPRPASNISDYSGNFHNFIPFGFEAGTITKSYFLTNQCYRCPNQIQEAFPALYIDGSSFLKSNDDFNFPFPFSAGLFFKKIQTETKTPLIYKEDCFQLKIDEYGNVIFSVFSGVDIVSITSSKKISDSNQHFFSVAATQNQITIMVDDVFNSLAVPQIDLNQSLAPIYLFSNPITDDFAQGYAHSVFFTLDELSGDILQTLQNQIEPYGFNLITFLYDDAAGTSTGSPYALKIKTIWNPYYPYKIKQFYNYQNEFPTITETLN